MCGNIIDQILQESLEGVAALSVSSGGMLYRHIDNTVRGQHQKVADLRQICICLYHRIYKESADQTVTGNLKIWILTKHFGCRPHRKLRAESANKAMLSSFITCNDRVHIITFSHHINHLRQFLWLMLQIIVHCYNKISTDMRKAAQKCRMLAKVSCHLYNSDSLIFVSKLCHDFERTVF